MNNAGTAKLLPDVRLKAGREFRHRRDANRDRHEPHQRQQAQHHAATTGSSAALRRTTRLLDELRIPVIECG